MDLEIQNVYEQKGIASNTGPWADYGRRSKCTPNRIFSTSGAIKISKSTDITQKSRAKKSQNPLILHRHPGHKISKSTDITQTSRA
jgi:hypothetical protein